MCVCLFLFLPAQQLWVGEDLLQSVVVADAKGEDGLSWVAGKMPGYARRERQHHLPCDLHNTSGTEEEGDKAKQKHTLPSVPSLLKLISASIHNKCRSWHCTEEGHVDVLAGVCAFEIGIDGFCEGSCHW